jgi:cytochrome c biogenesis protein CcmG/thiol:disulfide interchange protein DsbE
MNLTRALWVAALATPLLVALAMGFGKDPHSVPSMLVGKPAPQFRLVDLDGNTVDSAALRGQPVLINFWATWCYPCQAEHDLLQDTARQVAGRAHVLGIVYEDQAPTVLKYVSTHGAAYPQLLDPGSQVAMDFGVAGVPESFIIDSSGYIVHKQAGVMRPEILQKHFFALLGPS